jgi:hypothetical protein
MEGRLTLRHVAALLCLTALVPQTALAQKAEQTYCASYDLPQSYQTDAFAAPMTYRVQNTPNGKVLIAEGQIMSGESQRLQQAIANAGAIEEIWFNSPGGAAMEGPYMGRIIRARNMAVRLRKDYACISACSYAFLGGVIRTVEPGAYYGIHMFSATGDSQGMLELFNRFQGVSAKRAELLRKGNPQKNVDAAVAEYVAQELRTWEKESAKIAAIRARYLVEMSLSLDFMTDAFNTDSNKVCYLSQAGLKRYNVFNAN